MSMTDPIADMLTRIRNALMAKHDKANIPMSKVKAEIATLLKEEGYIKNYKLIKDKDKNKNMIRIYLKYDSEEINIFQKIRIYLSFLFGFGVR